MPPDELSASSDIETNTHPSLSFKTKFHSTHKTLNSLKPVLKKNTSTSSILLQKDYWRTNDRHWSKCVSESGKQSVRFNPDITEVKFLPETPVKESFKTCYFSLDVSLVEWDRWSSTAALNDGVLRQVLLESVLLLAFNN